MNKLKLSVSIVLSFLLVNNLLAQTSSNNYSLVDNLHPVSPIASQFVKYTELPVSEYTGLPTIEVPLYQIEADGVKIPLNLTYHASGIRVNEEASWVGLGWDLQCGSIVQTINDGDDLNSFSLQDGDPVPNVQKLLPDFIGTPLPSEFPLRYQYGSIPQLDGGGWSNTIPDNPPGTYQAYKIFTDYYMPVNGQCDTRPENFFISHGFYDSEPDIFKANFLGYSIKFILDWSSINQALTTNGVAGSINSFIVLNKRGYKVTFNSDNTFTILVPDGTQFNFQQRSTVMAQSTTNSPFGNAVSGNNPSSRIWMLTGIITKNKQLINFNYSVTGVSNCFPSYSEDWQSATFQQTVQYDENNYIPPYTRAFSQSGLGFTTALKGNLSKTFVNLSEPRVYLSSIVFPKGQVNFFTSPTQDISNGMELDSVAIIGTQLIKSYKLNYSYYNTSGTGGHGWNTGTTYGNMPSLRLKLLSLKDNSGALYQFNYNSTPLPNKDCFAQDYWGYYNGQLSDTTLIPNPAQFNKTGMVNNGDNHSANVTYNQAGILQQIIYPTGGSVTFNYELNTFNNNNINYWVPDFSTSSNTISHGNGLRVHSIIWNQANGTQSKQDVYAYSTGLAILPVNMFRTFNTTFYAVTGTIENLNTYTMVGANASGYYSSNPFSSITGIGYDTVSHQQLDQNGNAIGKTVTIYSNRADIIDNTAANFSQQSSSLPATKDRTGPENGSVVSVFYYDQQNNLLKNVNNSYSTIFSPTYYGAKLLGYDNFIYWGSNGTFIYNFLDQHIVGYYPIYDFESLLSNSIETNYYGTNSLVNTTTNTYDQYNQLSSVTKSNSDNIPEQTGFLYPYSNTGNAVYTAMVASNRLSDVVEVIKNKIYPSSGPTETYLFTRNYMQSGSLFLASNDNVNSHPSLNMPTVTTYDQYDTSNGNLFQYTTNTVPNSFIYDYNKEYVIAEVKNALYTSIAYTSFEADGTGRWKYTGTPITSPTAPTGLKVYSLPSGNIYRDSLNTAQTYVVSYWSNSGPQTVNGNTTSSQGYTYNGWTYYEHSIVNPSGGIITVSGSGSIDELRLYPSNAQMTTYTFNPLVGVSSSTNERGQITYYQYDSSSRLINIKDQHGNITKHMDYHYQGQ